MSPQQKIKWAVLVKFWGDPVNGSWPEKVAVTADNVDELFDELEAAEEDWAQDELRYNFRCNGIPTGLPAPYSRHYESEMLAAKMPDGTWVTWCHWYGGGKHGEPEAIDWMEDAREVDCVEEEKLVVVQTFSVKP